MCYKYYDSKDEVETKFEFGDISLEMKSKKEKFEGLFKRKLLVINESGFQHEPKEVTHYQEVTWPDNHAPD